MRLSSREWLTLKSLRAYLYCSGRCGVRMCVGGLWRVGRACGAGARVGGDTLVSHVGRSGLQSSCVGACVRVSV